MPPSRLCRGPPVLVPTGSVTTTTISLSRESVLSALSLLKPSQHHFPSARVSQFLGCAVSGGGRERRSAAEWPRRWRRGTPRRTASAWAARRIRRPTSRPRCWFPPDHRSSWTRRSRTAAATRSSAAAAAGSSTAATRTPTPPPRSRSSAPTSAPSRASTTS